MKNTGGRVHYQIGSTCRIICLDGRVSEESYTILSDRSDRKGLVSIAGRDDRPFMVQNRRILPTNVEGKVVAIETGGKCRGVCPKCNYVGDIDISQDKMICNLHGPIDVFWVCDKPKTASVSKIKTKEVKIMDTTTKASKVKVNLKSEVNLTDIAKLPNCELWTKNGVKFNNERIDVRSHTLIFSGDNPRKLCFNTYNGFLGKNKDVLPVVEFINDEPHGGKKPWYYVDDLAKTRKKLEKDGYEIHK